MKTFGLALLSVVLVFTLGCTLNSLQGMGQHGQCIQPSPEVFAAAQVDAEMAASYLWKMTTGDEEISSSPQLFTLTSHAMNDAKIADWLICLATHKDNYNDDQISHLHKLKDFMRTRPTPKQLAAWHKVNIIPKTSSTDNTPKIHPVTIIAR